MVEEDGVRRLRRAGLRPDLPGGRGGRDPPLPGDEDDGAREAPVLDLSSERLADLREAIRGETDIFRLRRLERPGTDRDEEEDDSEQRGASSGHETPPCDHRDELLVGSCSFMSAPGS